MRSRRSCSPNRSGSASPACVERCPRDVKPGKLIDAARQLVVRQRGETYLSPDEVPELLDPDLPQQLLVSAFRRYRR